MKASKCVKCDKPAVAYPDGVWFTLYCADHTGNGTPTVDRAAVAASVNAPVSRMEDDDFELGMDPVLAYACGYCGADAGHECKKLRVRRFHEVRVVGAMGAPEYKALLCESYRFQRALYAAERAEKLASASDTDNCDVCKDETPIDEMANNQGRCVACADYYV